MADRYAAALERGGNTCRPSGSRLEQPAAWSLRALGVSSTWWTHCCSSTGIERPWQTAAGDLRAAGIVEHGRTRLFARRDRRRRAHRQHPHRVGRRRTTTLHGRWRRLQADPLGREGRSPRAPRQAAGRRRLPVVGPGQLPDRHRCARRRRRVRRRAWSRSRPLTAALICGAWLVSGASTPARTESARRRKSLRFRRCTRSGLDGVERRGGHGVVAATVVHRRVEVRDLLGVQRVVDVEHP